MIRMRKSGVSGCSCPIHFEIIHNEININRIQMTIYNLEAIYIQTKGRVEFEWSGTEG